MKNQRLFLNPRVNMDFNQFFDPSLKIKWGQITNSIED